MTSEATASAVRSQKTAIFKRTLGDKYMKTIGKIVAVKLVTIALALAALTTPVRAGQLLPNGLSGVNGLTSLNGLSGVNGMCPPNGRCASSGATSFVGIWTESGIDPSMPLAAAIATGTKPPST